MDMNALLAGEQRSLLHAKFGRSSDRGRHIDAANGFAAHLRASLYPHRRDAFAGTKGACALPQR